MTQRRKSKNGSGTAPCEPAHLLAGAGAGCLCGCGAVAAQKKSFPNRTKRKQKNSLLRTLPCLQASGGPYG